MPGNKISLVVATEPKRRSAGCGQRKPASGPIRTDRVFQSRRRDRNRHPLESRRRAPALPRQRKQCAPPPRPRARGSGPGHRTHHRRSRGRRCPPTAGPRWARADAKFKSRRSCEEAAPGIVGGARPRSTMGGSAAPCTAASGLLQLRRGGPVARGRRGRIPAPGPEGAGVPDHHATPAAGSAPEGPRSRGARHQDPTPLEKQGGSRV
ncbi:uncharacterized protein LOC123612604 [Camelus bactrianus]|uniref:Uncharacterized protein LOC123612604 n=1 Tax=Camelus bactrianus TaxID=9837 RepID=A0AC58RA46_CAMBA